MPRIPLPPADYYRLRYLQAAAEHAQACAEAVALRAAGEAQQRQQQFLAALAAAGHAHDFDPCIPYRWDDDTTALVADDAPHTQATA